MSNGAVFGLLIVLLTEVGTSGGVPANAVTKGVSKSESPTAFVALTV